MMSSKEKILIIDDDDRNIFALSAVLKAKGYSCLTVPSAEEGMSLLLSDEVRIGIVLLDMMMPDLDGYEMLSLIRQNKKISDIPVVAVTAQAMAGARESCLKAGANEYISKPVDVDELLIILNKHLTK